MSHVHRLQHGLVFDHAQHLFSQVPFLRRAAHVEQILGFACSRPLRFKLRVVCRSWAVTLRLLVHGGQGDCETSRRPCNDRVFLMLNTPGTSRWNAVEAHTGFGLAIAPIVARLVTPDECGIIINSETGTPGPGCRRLWTTQRRQGSGIRERRKACAQRKLKQNTHSP